MKYDGQKLTAPDSHKIVAVWDHTSQAGATGKYRWLCKTANGQMYLYWCLDEGITVKQGNWHNVNTHGYWASLAKNCSPVWSCSDADLATVQGEKCMCDLHQLMRGEGHNAGCPEKSIGKGESQ